MKKFCLLIIALIIAGCTGKEEIAEGDKKLESIPENKSVETLVFYSTVEVVGRNQSPHIVTVKDRLDFGKLPQGMTEKKEILLENNKKKQVRVNSVVNGSIASWIRFEKEEFTIPPGGNTTQNVYLSVPYEAKPGNYTGYVTFIIEEL